MSSVDRFSCNFHTARAQESTVTVLEDWRDYKASRRITFECMINGARGQAGYTDTMLAMHALSAAETEASWLRNMNG